MSLEVFVQKEAIAQEELKSALLALQGNTTMKLVQNKLMIVFCVQQGKDDSSLIPLYINQAFFGLIVLKNLISDFESETTWEYTFDFVLQDRE